MSEEDANVENKNDNSNKVEKGSNYAGSLVGVFMLAAFVGVLTQCSDEAPNPYNIQKSDPANPVLVVEKGVEIEGVRIGAYIGSLPSGLHVIYSKDDDSYMIAMKYQDSGIDRGYGFFGMDTLPHNYAPNKEPSAQSENLSLWTIANEADIIKEGFVGSGLYKYHIDGALLNGTGLTLSVLIDTDSGLEKGYGYMGLNVVEPNKANSYAPK